MDKRTLLFVACVTLSFFAIQTYFGAPRQEEKGAPVSAPALVATQSIAPLVAARNVEPVNLGNEQFYVIETPTQQLVFSNLGGSLAEINLPFRSKENQASVVKEIDIDRQILSNSPQNATFPLHSYTAISNGSRVVKEGTQGGYYPLLRRDILSKDGSVESKLSPEFYSLSTGASPFKLSRFEEGLIEFEGSYSGHRITKTYFVPADAGPYTFLLTIRVDGEGDDLWLSSGLPDVELLGGSYSPLLKYQYLKSKQQEVDELSLPKGTELIEDKTANWISNCNGFFGLILDPLAVNRPGLKVEKIDGSEAPTRLTKVDPPYEIYPEDSYPAYNASIPLKGNATTELRIFAGPYDEKLLSALDGLYENPITGYNPDYTSAQSIQGWFSFISQPFAQFLLFLIQIFYAITSSWAASILLLTIALKAMTYPLNGWSIRSQLKMQEIAPKVKAIQERYKKDPKRMQMETMNLYREKGINPWTGCMPMLLQMPFLFGMFYLLKSAFPLRGALFIPGWIDDLAAPDVIFSWHAPLWLIGNELHLLPFLLGATMILQQRMMPKSATVPSDQEKQQKIMGNMMAALFTVMFYGFPSGLNLYFLFSTLLGIAQQWYTMKQLRIGTCEPGSNS